MSRSSLGERPVLPAAQQASGAAGRSELWAATAASSSSCSSSAGVGGVDADPLAERPQPLFPGHLRHRSAADRAHRPGRAGGSRARRSGASAPCARPRRGRSARARRRRRRRAAARAGRSRAGRRGRCGACRRRSGGCRSQSAQNGSETGLMKPISPAPVGEGVDAGGGVGLARALDAAGGPPRSSPAPRRRSARRRRCQARSPSSGMNSMKRTWKPRSRARSQKRRTSSRPRPGIGTALTLTGLDLGEGGDRVEPGQHAVERVAAGDLEEAGAGEAVDRDVDPVDPGGDEVGGLVGEQVAVGGQREVVDALDRAPARSTSAGNSRRTSGSPPVRRTSVDAEPGRRGGPAARSPRRRGSPPRDPVGIPSAGMQ